ncbi:MAG TPA: SUMF1/EgtB/PvdO family nonheme iron enzyme [Thermoanaerobaculia bacterium]|nr:SUMF1/EgtB/PvdO family nonheme iron enzyme [Thermoanaerobaculia bacterium]
MPDPQILAEALVLLLSQALPTLVAAGDKAAGKAVEEVGKQAGAAVSGKVKEIWGRLRGKVEEKEAAKEAVDDLAEDPADADRQAALRRQLVKILMADPDLAALLASLAEAARTEIAITRQVSTGNQGVAVGGDVHGGIHLHNSSPLTAATSPDRTDPAALRRAYLSRLIEQVGVLSLTGIDPAAARGEAEARLSLDAIYTGLWTLTSAEDADRRYAWRRLSALEQLNRHGRLVLLGDPGSGKSTFVHFVALCHAGEILGHSQINLDLLRAPLPQEGVGDPEDKPEPQPWEHGPLLPVRVVLRDFAARGLPPAGERVTARHLQTFLEEGFDKDCLDGFARFLFKELQEKGGLLLFDGLDEVPEAESRRDRLRQAVEEFVRSFGKCRVLVTSRTYAYRSQDWRLDRFAEAELAPFSEAQIETFVERWYDQVAATGRLGFEEARGRAQLLTQAVLGSDRLQGLAERPLLLTLMASLHTWRGGSLPEKREQLYADAVELLLNLWESQRIIRDPDGTTRLMQPSLAQYLDVGKDQVRQVLEELAFEVHACGDLAGTADVPEGELVLRLMRLGRKPGTNPAELVEYLSQRAGLLVPRGVEVYAFPHRTFQEYLAACHLTAKGFPRELAELGRREPERWREVVLLAGAKAARGAPFATWSLAERLCPVEPAESMGPEDVWGAHLAGQVIAEAADLENLDETDRKKLERLQGWHVHLLTTDLLPARERALAGKTLARLGDPRFDPECGYLPREPLLGFVEVPAGKFVMGSDNGPTAESPRHEVELPRYFISRYPVTVAQYRAFTESTGYKAHPASLGGVANHPVAIVSFHDALAYCAWLQECLGGWGWLEGGWKVTLPSEAEWEKASRGKDGREYPWGKGADPEKANYGETGISEPSTVGCFPLGASPFGCEEMSGNVWEWTRSLWGKDVGEVSYRYPYKAGDGREDLEASSEVLRVLRGGAFYNDTGDVRCAYRSWYYPRHRDRLVGFRLVLVPFSSDL